MNKTNWKDKINEVLIEKTNSKKVPVSFKITEESIELLNKVFENGGGKSEFINALIMETKNDINLLDRVLNKIKKD